MSTPDPIAVRADPPAVLDVPPAHLELSWRPLQLRDVDRLHDLITAVETADRSPIRHSLDEVLGILGGSWKDLERDTLGGLDHDGVLRAYAVVEVNPGDAHVVRALLRGGVHPGWRGRGIGRAVLAWMEGRGRQKLAATGTPLPARLAVYVDEQARDHRRLYAAAGFSPIRWYTDMRRDLSRPLPPVELREGVRIAPWSPGIDEEVRQAHNDAVAGHWGAGPQTHEMWHHDDGHLAPAWSFVAVDESGDDRQVAGYLLSARYEQDWPALGYTCGYTDVVGVRPPWRGQGLTASLLVTAMAAYRDDGMQYACLRADTADATGTYPFYEHLGYEPRHGTVMYSVEI